VEDKIFPAIYPLIILSLIDSLSKDWSLFLLVLSISVFFCDYLCNLSPRFIDIASSILLIKPNTLMGIISIILIMNPSTWIGLLTLFFFLM
jgi:hypothetical protein